MKSFVLLSEKVWHVKLFEKLRRNGEQKWFHIKSKDEFNLSHLLSIQPDVIFIPHWSYLIPKEIFTKFQCIVFHMTDLPYGRGGSPLQNLIIRGHNDTVISAIKVSEGLDTGSVYLKKPLSLQGSAQEIFERAGEVIGDMITEIIEKNPVPLSQQGEVVVFKRRKPEESNIGHLRDPRKIYDHIRMLDAEGYPKAYIEAEHYLIEFSEAQLNKDQSITAHVTIIPK